MKRTTTTFAALTFAELGLAETVSTRLLVGAARLMVQIYKKDQAVAVFLAQGKEPKASALVSDRGLRDAGMCDE